MPTSAEPEVIPSNREKGDLQIIVRTLQQGKGTFKILVRTSLKGTIQHEVGVDVVHLAVERRSHY